VRYVRGAACKSAGKSAGRSFDPAGLWLSSTAITALIDSRCALNLAELSDEREACAGYRSERSVCSSSSSSPAASHGSISIACLPICGEISVRAHGADDTRTRRAWRRWLRSSDARIPDGVPAECRSRRSDLRSPGGSALNCGAGYFDIGNDHGLPSNRPRGILIGSGTEHREKGESQEAQGRNSGDKAEGARFCDCHFGGGGTRESSLSSTREAINDAECIISADPHSNPISY